MATFTATGSKQSSYSYTLTLTQNYTTGSSKITYNYTLICTTSNNYYYQDTGTTRICKIKYNNVEKTIFDNYSQISVNKNGSTTLETGSIELDRFTTSAYTPDVYFSVYTTASSSYLPGYATHDYSAGDAVPASATACSAPTITAPAADAKVSRTSGFTLTWSAGTAGTNNPITGYKIQQAIGNGSWADFATTNASTLSYKITPGTSINEGVNLWYRVKCIETITLADNWSGSRKVITNTRLNVAPTLNQSSQTITSSAGAVSVTATKSSGASGIVWYSGSTSLGTTNPQSMNPNKGSSLTYTAYNVDAIGELSTVGTSITITRNSTPVVNSLSITLKSETNFAYSYIISSASANRSKTATAHSWRIKYGTNKATTTIASTETISNYNLFNAISSTVNGSISYTIEYCYSDGTEWSAWKSSSSYSIGSAVNGIAVYNQYGNTNITGTDFTAGSLYDKGRLYYNIGGKSDSNFTFDSFVTTNPSLTKGNTGTGYANFTITSPNSLQDATTYTIKFKIKSVTGGNWTMEAQFSFKTSDVPMSSITLVQSSSTENNFNPYTVSGTGTVKIGQKIGNLTLSKLYIYGSSQSDAPSSKRHSLFSQTGGSVSGSTYTTPSFQLTSLYQIKVNGSGGDGWYSDESINDQDFYIVANYTNTLGKTYTIYTSLKINFITTPDFASALTYKINDYPISEYPNLKLQYNKKLTVSATLCTYNTGTYTIKLQWQPSGGSWSNLGSTTYTRANNLTGKYDNYTASITVNNLGYITSTTYNLRLQIYHNSRTSSKDTSTTTFTGSNNAIMQYKGAINFKGFDKAKSQAQYGFTNSEYGVNLSTPSNATSITGYFEGHLPNSSTFSSYGGPATGSSFLNNTTISTNSGFPSDWVQITGRIKVIVDTTQAVSSSSNITQQLIYYSNEVVFYNTVPTVSYRENHVGINAVTFTSSDVFRIQSLDNRNTVYFVKDNTNATITLNSASIEMAGFKIDCGSW